MGVDAFGSLIGYKIINLPDDAQALKELGSPMEIQFVGISKEGDLPPLTLDDRDAALIMIAIAGALMRTLARTMDR